MQKPADQPQVVVAQPTPAQPEVAKPTADQPPRGPVKDRSCTDIFCIILFLVFLIGWAVVGYYGINWGNPQRLLHPIDSNGKACGIDEGFKNRHHLFYFDLTRCAHPDVLFTGCPTQQVCVKECPNETFFADVAAAQLGEEATKKKMICKENVTMSNYTVQQLVDNGNCARWYIRSSPISGRCIPLLTNLSLNDEVFKDVLKSPAIPSSLLEQAGFTVEDLVNGSRLLADLLNAGQTFQRVLEDFNKTWWIILIGLILAMIIAFIWIVLLKFIAGFMILLSVFATLLLQGVGCWFCFTRYYDLINFPKNNLTLAQIGFTTRLDSYLTVSTTWLIFLIIMAIAMFIILMIIIFIRNRIRLAIALIGHASNAVGDLMSTLVFPSFPWVFQVLTIAYFCAVAVHVAAMGNPTFRAVDHFNQTTDCTCPSIIDSQGTCIPLGFEQMCGAKCPGVVCQFFQHGGTDIVSVVLQIYNFFGLLWGLFFISAMGEMVLAGAFASWYWAFNKPNDIPSYALTSSLFRTLFYHLGTVAFGSLIIACLRLIRVLLEYLDRKVREFSDNCCSRAALVVCKCFCWLFEKLICFLNRNTYIICAISGTNFCSSASEAFNLLLRNIERVAVLDKVTDLLLLLGRLVVTTTVFFASFFVFTNRIGFINDYIPPTNYYLVPVLTTTMGAFFIADSFFSVYSMAVDTIFLCFLQDSEQNDGSVEKPFYMSTGLLEILEKKNKTVNDKAVNETTANKT